jgi:hypothetical protein
MSLLLLPIYGLFNDSLSNSGYVTSSDQTISQQWSGEYVKGCDRDIIFGTNEASVWIDLGEPRNISVF